MALREPDPQADVLSRVQANVERVIQGKGSVVRQVEMLRELGAKSSKQLPGGWDNGSDDVPMLRLVGEEPGDLS